jgi:hypothetical protein
MDGAHNGRRPTATPAFQEDRAMKSHFTHRPAQDHANPTTPSARSVGRLSACAILTLAVVAAFGRPASAQGIVFDLYNTGGVTDRPAGPPAQTYFGTFNKPAAITQVATYHWHSGQGAGPGTITLRGNNGHTYGPYPTTGGVNHVATLNVTVAAGIYFVVDSDPSSWSYNFQAPSNGSGFTRVFGSLVNPPSAPNPGSAPPASAKPAVASFGSPALSGYRIGQCFRGTGQLGNGSDCSGQTSADTFCRAEGYSSALNFKTQVLMWPMTTRALGDGAICSIAPGSASYLRCFSFEYVNCKR